MRLLRINLELVFAAGFQVAFVWNYFVSSTGQYFVLSFVQQTRASINGVIQLRSFCCFACCIGTASERVALHGEVFTRDTNVWIRLRVNVRNWSMWYQYRSFLLCNGTWYAIVLFSCIRVMCIILAQSLFSYRSYPGNIFRSERIAASACSIRYYVQTITSNVYYRICQELCRL